MACSPHYVMLCYNCTEEGLTLQRGLFDANGEKQLRVPYRISHHVIESDSSLGGGGKETARSPDTDGKPPSGGSLVLSEKRSSARSLP